MYYSDNNHYEKIKNLGYIPVGLGDKIDTKKFITDKSGKNISEKILTMENTLFTTGFGKMSCINYLMNGLVFVNTENFG